jgi:D-aspartate ligase
MLTQLATEYGIRPVVLACTDEFTGWLNENRDIVGQYADSLLPARDTPDKMSDKSRFYRWASEHDLRLPETRFVDSAEDLTQAAQEMTFPLVVKPPHRTARWLEASGGSKVCKVHSSAELLQLAPSLFAAVNELILQAWVPGPSSLTRELSVCLDADGNFLTGIVLQKIRQWAPETGTGSLAVQIHDEEVMTTGLEILRRLAHVGFCQVEFKRSETDGRLYIIEMNPSRASLNFPLCEASGVDMTYIWYCAAAGLPLPANRDVTHPGAKWICWKRDLAAAFVSWRQGKLGFREWLKSVRGHKWSADIQLDDPMPLLADVVRKLAALSWRPDGARRFASRGLLGPSPRRTVVDRQTPVVLLGIDRLLGLQLARILWQHGIPTIGVAVDPKSHYCRTRAATQIVDADEVERDPNQFFKKLNAEYAARPVVIPCMDEFVFWLNDNRDIVEAHADFLLPPAKSLELLGDKSLFYRYCIERKLPIPATRFVSSRKELEAAAREMHFPLVVKPPRRSAAWMKATDGSKVLRADDPADLLNCAPDLLGVTDELILQAWVEGGDDCMHSLYVCLDHESRPVVSSIVGRKVRQWPPDIGVGTLSTEVREDELVEIGLRILQELGYVGSGSMQFKRDKRSGDFFIIEMNTRFALGAPLFEASGIAATLSHYCLAAGLPLPQNRSVTQRGRKWICWKRDLASAFVHWRRGDLTVSQWLNSLRGRKRSADFHLRDPMPLLADIGRKLKTAFS